MTVSLGVMAAILVVDDDDPVRAMMSQLLRARGYTILEARNGKEALDKIVPMRADLVITDLFMPEMGGIQLITVLRREFPDVKVIAMTGVPRSHSVLRVAASLGATGTMTKPFTAEKLETLIANVLANDAYEASA
jgi:CheY-like chemotaxis protein